MFDLNTIITNALNQAIEQATKPLIERITALELQALTPDLTNIYTRLDTLEGQVADVITAEQVDNLIEAALDNIDWESQVQEVLNGSMLEEQVNDAIDEVLSELRISRR